MNHLYTKIPHHINGCGIVIYLTSCVRFWSLGIVFTSTHKAGSRMILETGIKYNDKPMITIPNRISKINPFLFFMAISFSILYHEYINKSIHKNPRLSRGFLCILIRF